MSRLTLAALLLSLLPLPTLAKTSAGFGVGVRVVASATVRAELRSSGGAFADVQADRRGRAAPMLVVENRLSPMRQGVASVALPTGDSLVTVLY